jgi:hypothetical protein
MVIDMNETKLRTIEELRAFLAGTEAVQFQPTQPSTNRYPMIEAVLKRFSYLRLKRTEKGVVLRYLARVTGYSRQQLTRLVRRYGEAKHLTKHYRPPAHGFIRRFTAEDIRLLVETDQLHGNLSGPATKRLLYRAFTQFGDTRYERLSTISVSHLYNLRRAAGYQKLRQHWTKTRPTALPIGERRKPTWDGRPGYIRIDSVHQGDLDGIKGVYHINAVDSLTQWQLIATCEKISEAFLLPVLEELLHGFPFALLGFHADNGSEYINRRLAQMLNKLNIEFTKSRPRHSNDNALAETKNGAVIRKHLGYSHIPQRFAHEVNALCRDVLNPYVNFHRPCFFPVETLDAKGKIRKRYPHDQVMTPYEKLRSLPQAEQFLKPGITLATLDAQANALSDNEAARRLNEARNQLLQSIQRRSKPAA